MRNRRITFESDAEAALDAAAAEHASQVGPLVWANGRVITYSRYEKGRLYLLFDNGQALSIVGDFKIELLTGQGGGPKAEALPIQADFIEGEAEEVVEQTALEQALRGQVMNPDDQPY